jgi:hypothetical protein
VVKTVRRFVPGEGAVPGVFVTTHALLARVVDASEADIPWLVQYYELWLLHTLGYIATHTIPPAVALDQSVDAWQPLPSTLQSRLETILTDAMAASQL